MKFLADESCDFIIVDYLRQAGHDVSYIAESSPGIEDSEVISKAFREKRVY